MSAGKALLRTVNDHKAKVAGPHMLLSAENPKYPDKNQLGLNHDQVLSHLQGAGYDAHEVNGHYGSPEKSIIVYGVNHEHAENLHNLAARMGQDSSIYSNGTNHEMRYHHGADAGRKVLGQGTDFHTQKPTDLFTTLPGGMHHFTHRFDFPKESA